MAQCVVPVSDDALILPVDFGQGETGYSGFALLVYGKDEGYLLLGVGRNSNLHAEVLAVGVVEFVLQRCLCIVGVGDGSELQHLVVVDGVVDVADENAVRCFVPLRVEVAGGLFLALSEHQLVDHVELDGHGSIGLVAYLNLVVFLHAVVGHEDAYFDGHIVVVGIEGGESLAVTCCGGDELLFVDEEHLAGVVAHDIIAPAGQFELLGIVGEGESRHGGTDYAAEVGIGNHVDPWHRGVGVSDHIVAAILVEAAVLVVVLQTAPYAELAAGLEGGVFHLVLIVLVGSFEPLQLLLDGEVVVGVETQACHAAQEGAFGIGDFVAVENIDVTSLLVRSPQVLGVGHVADEVGETVAVLASTVGAVVHLHVVDDDQVEQQAVDLEVFEGTQQLFGETGALGTVDFQQQDGEVATDAETPQVALRHGVLL